MTDRNERHNEKDHATAVSDLHWTRTNTFILLAGIVVLILGYLCLAMAKGEISTLMARMSPFLILLGYVISIMSVVFESKSALHRED